MFTTAPFQIYITEWPVRLTWIAFSTLWVFWGLSWCIRFTFGGDRHSLKIQSSRVAVDNDPTVQVHTLPPWTVNLFNRLNRAHEMIWDLVLLLLSVLILNTFARGSTRAVMIIAWIIVAFAAVHFCIEVAFVHRYLRLIFAIIFYGLGLAVVGLAFKQGFH